MRAVIVRDQMDLEPGRDVAVKVIKKGEKFQMTIGISPENLDRIFVRFERITAPDEPSTGNGSLDHKTNR